MKEEIKQVFRKYHIEYNMNCYRAIKNAEKNPEFKKELKNVIDKYKNGN